MKFWFDTEFYEDGKKIELISIGVVAEDGRTYYAETPFANAAATATEWLRENVAPHLTGPHVERKQIATDLISFMGPKPEIWAYYADYDWVALCQLFGRMIDLPKGWPMFCRDVKQLCESVGNPTLPDQKSTEHHALADARWTKEAWEFLQKFQAPDTGHTERPSKDTASKPGLAAASPLNDPGRAPDPFVDAAERAALGLP